MKKYMITLNDKVYEVEIEEVTELAGEEKGEKEAKITKKWSVLTSFTSNENIEWNNLCGCNFTTTSKFRPEDK